MPDDTKLPEALYLRSLNHLKNNLSLDCIVENSIPIPFFGDLEAYLQSPKRIVTAALNPSNIEFESKSGPRFDISSGLANARGLEGTLSDYFKNNPYSKWFSSFEPVLNGANASYGGKIARVAYQSTALHIDICTPLATTPTWSGLPADAKAVLTREGNEIFLDLIEALKPDMIVASVGRAHLAAIEHLFDEKADWQEIATYTTTHAGKPLRSPLRTSVKNLKPLVGKPIFFVNGSAADTPFGRFTNVRKTEVGQALHQILNS